MDEGLAKIRHDRSVKDFPQLKLEDDEYVEFAFKRARVCLMAILGGVIFGLGAILIVFLVASFGVSPTDALGQRFMGIILLALMLAILLIGVIALMVYRGNKMFITNKHVIQFVMQSPMANSVNIIDLQSVEDASYRQEGILQKMFGYGTLRLSTIGDETTYTFPYSDIKSSELRAVSKLITEAKKIKKRKTVKQEVEEEAED